MGGGDVLFIMGVVTLILIMLDGKRRINKRAAVAQVSPMSKMQHNLASPARTAQLLHQTKAPTQTSQPALPAVAITPCLPTSSGSLIGSTLHIEGNVNAREPLVIHGTIAGDVTAMEHPVTITASGSVSCRIQARTICVAGSVAGRLVATDQAILLASARVSGSIEAKRLKCEDGAWLQAAVSITAH